MGRLKNFRIINYFSLNTGRFNTVFGIAFEASNAAQNTGILDRYKSSKTGTGKDVLPSNKSERYLFYVFTSFWLLMHGPLLTHGLSVSENLIS